MAKDWSDWMPDDAPELEDEHLISREELIDRLRSEGISVTARQLHYWEGLGATPLPIRRSFKGAIRATYPHWTVDVVREFKRLQASGRRLATIGQALRRYAVSLQQRREQASESRRQVACPCCHGTGLVDWKSEPRGQVKDGG